MQFYAAVKLQRYAGCNKMQVCFVVYSFKPKALPPSLLVGLCVLYGLAIFFAVLGNVELNIFC
jgi:hypothetical protein